MSEQEKKLIDIVSKNQVIMGILAKTPSLHMKDWYLGAGCIPHTVWNHRSGFDLNHGIFDYDLVYFDDSDTSYEGEDSYIRQAKKLFGDARVEIRNQARVHLWHKDHFGYDIAPYTSTEAAISKWPTTATSIGIRLDEKGQIQVFAPCGLDDLLAMTVRPNKVNITEEIYMKKVERWIKIWPDLMVIPW
jgi:hypothetical protein